MFTSPIDTTLVELNDENKKIITKSATDITSVIDMMVTYASDNVLTKETGALTIKIIEDAIKDLSAVFDYESAKNKEYEKLTKMLSEANQKVRNLTIQIGQNNLNNPDALVAAMHYYEDIFRIWYKACGFHYASLEKMSPYGHFTFDFSSEIDEMEPDEKDSCMKHFKKYLSMLDMATEIFNKVKPIYEKDAGYDIIHDGYRSDLLGTHNNQQLLTKLFKHYFPDCTINNFNHRRNDYGSFSMNINVIISIKDIATMLQIVKTMG